MSFCSLKGLFFYYHIIRKDLINKYCFSSVKLIPKLNKVTLSLQTNHKEVAVPVVNLLNWILLLEFLTNSACNITLCNVVKLDHFTSFINSRIFVDIINVTHIYEFFLFVYFVWFRGLIHIIEQFPIPKGRIFKDKFKRRLDFISIEYFKFNRPQFYREKFFKKHVKCLTATSVKSTIWTDFSFCKYIPIHITGDTATLNLNMQFFFNVLLREEHKKVFLSGFKLFHRFKELKKYKVE